jgi:hypothetical protein
MTKSFNKLSELDAFKSECDDAYLIQDITIYQFWNEKIGLVLDRRHRLQLLDKYTLYSYSWFDDYNSDSDF